MDNFFKRTWLQINLDSIRNNFEAIRGAVRSDAKVMAVVKADAYGHGFEKIVKEMNDAGADWFAVSNLEEAIQIRQSGIDTPILILGYTPPEYAQKLAYNNISQAVLNKEYGFELAKYAEKAGVQVGIHIKIDTGMSRIGFVYHDSEKDGFVADDIAEVCALPSLYKEGIFTHFAKADEDGDGEVYTRLQYDLFLDIIDRLRAKGITFDLRHCCNSAGAINYPEMQLDMVRAGIILYGLSTQAHIVRSLGLKPTMELKTVVSMVKELDEGTPISYGGTYITDKKTKIATVPVGYADGYPRLLSNKAFMLINGQKAPVIGRVCMDQAMLDVTDIENVKPGDIVTVFGKDGNEEITVDTLANMIDVLNYEIICGISKRVPRAYVRNGNIESITGYMGV